MAIFLPETLPETSKVGEVASTRGASVSTLLVTPGVVAALAAYFILSFVSITYDETVVLWAISSRDSGGLAMEQVHIGYLMSGSGALLLGHTLYLYPKIAAYLGKLKGFTYGEYLCQQCRKISIVHMYS